jgi:hypothetical protein
MWSRTDEKQIPADASINQAESESVTEMLMGFFPTTRHAPSGIFFLRSSLPSLFLFSSGSERVTDDHSCEYTLSVLSKSHHDLQDPARGRVFG